MKVKVNKTRKAKKTQEVFYPSAELLVQACQEDYKNELESYNKIYDKVNISLAFCGVVLLVILEKFDLSYITRMVETNSYLGFLSETVPFCLSLVSSSFIVAATIQLLMLMRSTDITIFDSIYIRNDKIYTSLPDCAALWLIGSYTDSIDDLRGVVSEKQKKYDKAVKKIVIAILFHAIFLAIN